MSIRTPLYKGTLASGSTLYVGLPIREFRIGGQIAWKDATSAAAITLELSSFDYIDAPADEAGAAWEWHNSGVTVTGPSATAADSSLVNVADVHQRRARLKIVATANCDLEILDGIGG